MSQRVPSQRRAGPGVGARLVRAWLVVVLVVATLYLLLGMTAGVTGVELVLLGLFAIGGLWEATRRVRRGGPPRE